MHETPGYDPQVDPYLPSTPPVDERASRDLHTDVPAEVLAAARVGELVDHRPPPVMQHDVVLELRQFTDPLDGDMRWAVLAAYRGRETAFDYSAQAAARREYEHTGDAIGAALYMGRDDPWV